RFLLFLAVPLLVPEVGQPLAVRRPGGLAGPAPAGVGRERGLDGDPARRLGGGRPWGESRDGRGEATGDERMAHAVSSGSKSGGDLTAAGGPSSPRPSSPVPPPPFRGEEGEKQDILS